MKTCPRTKRGATQPCGGQMFRESVSAGNGGKWSKTVVKADEEGPGFITYSPPPVHHFATWVCLQCGYEMSDPRAVA